LLPTHKGQSDGF